VTRTILLGEAECLPLYATRSVRRASGFVLVGQPEKGAGAGVGWTDFGGRYVLISVAILRAGRPPDAATAREGRAG
jgi:hypothetical protein